MKSLLKLIVILLCIEKGEGHRLRSMTGQKPKTPASLDMVNGKRYLTLDDAQTEVSGAGLSLSPQSQLPVRTRRSSSDSQCGLHSILLQVRDLGLGYDSDETVLFKYCSGTCPLTRSNHHLTVSKLLLGGLLPNLEPGELWHSGPCCRPTRYEDMAFLDNQHRWHKVEKLFAAECSCVG